MYVLKRNLLIISICSFFVINAQGGFYFEKPTKTYVNVPFKLIGNLIVFEVKLNEIPLSFILDTGASHTFLFNQTNNNDLKLKNIRRKKVSGLGSSEPVESIKSSNNIFQVKGLVNRNQDIHLILNRDINFSSQLGIPIHGIIGCDLLKNFITEINYETRNIKFYNPENYKFNRLKKYKELEISLYKKRIYTHVEVGLETVSLRPVKLLLDTGSSDSIWLFENSIKGLVCPENKFRDYMGNGISGPIHGNRSRLKKMKLASFEIERVKVAFPDSVDIALAYKNKNRHGSIGAGVLKRFNTVFDLKNKKLYLKKNKFFKAPFEYNMSGIEIQHNGLRIEKVFDGKIKFSDEATKSSNARSAYSVNNLFKTSLVPVFEIIEVRENSPAEEVGIKEGDILLSVNRKKTHHYQISEIIEMLSEKNGKLLLLEIERDGRKIKFAFKLKRLL